MRHTAAVLLVSAALAACGSTSAARPTARATTSTSMATSITSQAPTTSTAPTTPAPKITAPKITTGTGATSTVDLTAKRPFDVFVPKSYTGSVAVPLVVLLHGYTVNGALQEVYFRLQPLAEQRGFLYVHPNGLVDPKGNGYWNATDACCNLYGAHVDDSAYLNAVIEKVQHKYNVDPKRIFLVGHSNGGFMSYRMACDHADKIAAIVSLAGATFQDPTRCRPSAPVNILEIHGTSDPTIHFNGGQIAGHKYPGARNTVATWAKYNGCGTKRTPRPATLDLDSKLTGAETTESAYSGCQPGGAVELWTINAGVHVPALSSAFPTAVIDFLFAHPKP